MPPEDGAPRPNGPWIALPPAWSRVRHRSLVIGQILRIIRDVSGHFESLSVADLADSINGEPTTMGRIVSIASSVGYNSSGAEISSVHHAISLIGFDRIRTLAVSILLMETAQSKRTAEVNRELAASSFISGVVAAEISRRSLSCDPEVAFICGSLRGYGRILAATYLPDQYALAVSQGGHHLQDRSFESVFGLSPLELGKHALAWMKVPDHILNSFVTPSPDVRKLHSPTGTTALILAADFGTRAANLLQTPDLENLNYESRMEDLSRDYDPALHLSRSATRELLHHIVAMLECFKYRAKSYVDSVETFRRVQCLADKQPLPPPYEMAVANAAPAPVNFAQETAEDSSGPGYYDI